MYTFDVHPYVPIAFSRERSPSKNMDSLEHLSPEQKILWVDIQFIKDRIVYWKQRADLKPDDVATEIEHLEQELAELEKEFSLDLLNHG